MPMTIPDVAERDSTPLSPTDFDAILFDLDGTLIDTAPDLLFALNRVMAEENKPPLSLAELLPFVSGGSPAMLQRGFRIAPDEPGFAALQERFLALYRANVARSSRLFPGMETVLGHIEAGPLRWGIVTNKSAWLTEPLTAALGLDRRAACIVSGDTTEHLKPHPASLLLACQRIGVEPARCLYVGDAAKDVEAGQRAGMKTAAALFGYLTPEDKPEEWGADWLLSSPGALADWLATKTPR
uniref:phosphoglycolate phosphatase n=1 Tax=Candidatus Kentrum sp. DK TaxID=2126562 RepID=A0A450T7V8_9GAMM|nr:MAG: phosphoglycolate phosphatase [Candidatus Kentron sp. DK]